MEKEARKYKKALELLTLDVRACLAAFDVEMIKPLSPERGARIAKICGALELRNDMVRRFTLGKKK